MIDFTKKRARIIFDYIHESHPFVMFSPNINKVGKRFSSSDWVVLHEIAQRLKYDSGSFLLKNDINLQNKTGKNFSEIELSLEKLIKFDIIKVLNEQKGIYQANPKYMWKGSMQTLLDKDIELAELATFETKIEGEISADDLTGKRVINAIIRKQAELRKSNPQDLQVLDLPGEEWIPIDKTEYEISNKGRIKSHHYKESKIVNVKSGEFRIKSVPQNVKELMASHWPEI